ncbi:hypothetical protein [Oceanobacillus sp. CAU 1775]
MRHYWKLLVLAIVILLTFGAYYIQTAIAKGVQVELDLKANVDTEGIHDDIEIYGNFYESSGQNEIYYGTGYDSFKLSSEGTHYQSESGYFERMTGAYYSPSKMEQLRKDYKGFMRGKDNLELFHENDTEVAYVGPFSQSRTNRGFYFDISILDKSTKDVQSFKIDLADETAYDFLSIETVELVDDEIHIFSNIQYQGQESLSIFKVDRNNKVVASQEALFESDDLVDFRIINDAYDFMKKPYLVIEKTISEWDEEGYYAQTAGIELFSYQVETGEIEKINVPEEWFTDSNHALEEWHATATTMIHDEMIYRTHFAEGEMMIRKYNMASGESSSDTISYNEDLNQELSSIHPIDNQKVAVISTSKGNGIRSRYLTILDIVTHEVIYEGEIKIKNAAKEIYVYDIEFYRVAIK